MKKAKKYSSWSKRVCIGNYEENYCVDELDNGFLVTYYKYNTKDYERVEEKKYYSPKNPLDDLDIDESDLDKQEKETTQSLREAWGKFIGSK